ncbi:MAG: alcohol dehydrogenase catalytic domain-containing protein [Clostridia bacterium]|nr:alcohol dehydrogenase catalytic domain-containing protein [Clostridia bacterium]
MKVVAITGEKKVQIIDIDQPTPKPGELLIKIKSCALCTWEQRVYTGVSKMQFPFVGGHEIAGEIVELGEGVDPQEFKIGSRAAVRILNKCGTCYYCRHGEENLCPHVNKLLLEGPEAYGMGGLGEFICVDTSKVWIYPKEIGFDEIALTEPLACVLNSMEKGKPQIADDVVIIGGGIMGMLHLMCAKLCGARVIFSEPDDLRRKFAQELGCDVAINPLQEDPVQAVRDLTDGRGADVVFNTTAIPAVAEQAVQMTGNLGRFVMYSSQHPDHPIQISPNWLHNSEAILTGAVSPSVQSFDRAVRSIAKKLIDVRQLISGTFDYTHADEAFREAVKPDTYRIIINF